MKFSPKTEKEVSQTKLLIPGECDFTVKSATDETSKTSGNEMIKLMLEVFDREGTSIIIYDYLVAVDAMAFKIRHFAYAVGLGSRYESGDFDSFDCDGKSGKCKVRTQPEKDGYPPKSVIADYIPLEEGSVAPKPKSAPPKTANPKAADPISGEAPTFTDQDIPF